MSRMQNGIVGVCGTKIIDGYAHNLSIGTSDLQTLVMLDDFIIYGEARRGGRPNRSGRRTLGHQIDQRRLAGMPAAFLNLALVGGKAQNPPIAERRA